MKIKRKIRNKKVFKPGRNIYISPHGMIIKMKSSWETKYADYLDSIKEPFYYEPMAFKTGAGKYWIDFYLPQKDIFVEIKGKLYPKAKAKIEQFRILYPDIELQVLFKEDLQKLGIL